MERKKKSSATAVTDSSVYISVKADMPAWVLTQTKETSVLTGRFWMRCVSLCHISVFFWPSADATTVCPVWRQSCCLRGRPRREICCWGLDVTVTPSLSPPDRTMKGTNTLSHMLKNTFCLVTLHMVACHPVEQCLWMFGLFICVPAFSFLLLVLYSNTTAWRAGMTAALTLMWTHL